jgi:hypothetical protein
MMPDTGPFRSIATRHCCRCIADSFKDHGIPFSGLGCEQFATWSQGGPIEFTGRKSGLSRDVGTGCTAAGGAARTRQITGNQLIAAVVLHQRRKRTAIRCSAHFPKQLSNLCQLQNYNADHRSVARTYMVSPLQPFGVDPSFNARSSMYHPYAAQRPWQYYNTTAGSSEVSDSGVPYAFFHRPAIGLKDGFPIVFPVCHSS